MSDDSNRKLLIGLLIGLGVGAAAMWLLTSSGSERRRRVLADAARVVADRVSCLGRGVEVLENRRASRAERALTDRIDRARAAGL